MKSVKIIVGLLALVVIPALIILLVRPGGGKGPEQRGGDEIEVAPGKDKFKITRTTVKGGVTEKLKKGEPQKISLVFQTSGRAADADWGLKGSGAFVLNTFVECESVILDKLETVHGNIKVVEKRTFTKARQKLDVFDTDVSLALYETLPLEEATLVVAVVGEAVANTPSPYAPIGKAVSGGAMLVAEMAKKFDGISMKETLSRYGINVPKKLEGKINEFIAKEVATNKLMRVEDVEGKSYRITYVQSAEGKPMDVEITRFDKREPMSEQEVLLLRRANALMDWQIIKGGEPKVGSEWTVDSGDFESLFDPYVEGRYSGEVVVRREQDEPNGDWKLKVKPGFVKIVSGRGKSNTTGQVRIDGGEAKIDEPNCRIKVMELVGKAGARNLSKHHLLFKSHVDGECTFRAILTSSPVENAEKSAQ